MNDHFEPTNNEQQKIAGEDVVSVWKGSGTQTSFFRRRFFEGYTQVETVDEKGKRHIHNIYTGKYFIQQLDKSQRIKHRIAYMLLMIFGFALLLLGSTRNIYANLSAISAIPAFAGMLGFGWVLVALFNEFTVPQRRTIGDYTASSFSLKRGGLVAAIGGAGACCATIVFLFINSNRLGQYFISIFSEAAAGAAGFAIRYLESKVVYVEKMSEEAGKYNM